MDVSVQKYNSEQPKSNQQRVSNQKVTSKQLATPQKPTGKQNFCNKLIKNVKLKKS